MTLDVDEAIRAVLDDLVAAAPDVDDTDAPEPSPRGAARRSPNGRWSRAAAIAAAAIVVAGIAGVIAVQSRDDTSSTRPHPTTVAPPSEIVATSGPATATTTSPSTLVPSVGTTSLPSVPPFTGELPPSWLSFQLAPAPVSLDLGVLDGRHVTIERTASSLCINYDGGSGGCTSTIDGRPLAATQYAGTGGSSDPVSVPPRYFRYWLTPSDVAPALVDADGNALCKPQPTAVEALGDATLWTCQSNDDLFAPPAYTVYHRGNETYLTPMDRARATPTDTT